MLFSNYSGHLYEAGCDEAGRGCLAGPVFAAAVILPVDFQNEILTDSKKLTEVVRDKLRKVIESEAIAWAVAQMDPEAIDQYNILWASVRAMHLALNKLPTNPQFILVDGNKFLPYSDIPHSCIVGGDAKYLSIAAASILAKTHRDEYMMNLHGEYPDYQWDKNKGYPTIHHREAIVKYGITPHHRRSFKLLPDPKPLTLF
ncbi:MAG: ribonuclease HII [Lewinellaceae bacterium]|nr:ribonuclease HII [Lewinellaceae bacterium]